MAFCNLCKTGYVKQNEQKAKVNTCEQLAREVLDPEVIVS